MEKRLDKEENQSKNATYSEDQRLNLCNKKIYLEVNVFYHEIHKKKKAWDKV